MRAWRSKRYGEEEKEEEEGCEGGEMRKWKWEAKMRRCWLMLKWQIKIR